MAEILAPFESEYKEFNELSRARGTIHSAYDFLIRQPNVALWMDSTDIAWEVCRAMRLGVNKQNACQLQRVALDAIVKSDSLFLMNGLDKLVQKLKSLEVSGNPETNPAYNEFLHHLKNGNDKEAYSVFVELPAITENIPIGCAIYSYGQFAKDGKLGSARALDFKRKMRDEISDNCTLLIGMNTFIREAVEYDANKGLPPSD